MLLCDMNPNLRFAQNIVFVPVGRQVCPSDNRIFYVTSGVGTLAIHGSSYPLAPGTFALINSGELYQLQPGAPLSMIVFNFDYSFERSNIVNFIPPIPVSGGESAGEVYRDHIDDCAALNEPLVLSDMNFIEGELKTILDVYESQEVYYREKASSLFKTVLITIAKTKMVSNNRAGRTALQLIRYLQEHYNENLTSEMIAEQFNYHAYHINRLMRNATGTTVHKYLINYRITAAKNLLTCTELSVQEIAFKVGFESTAYFSNSFKKMIGCSPNEFRRLQRQSF